MKRIFVAALGTLVAVGILPFGSSQAATSGPGHPDCLAYGESCEYWAARYDGPAATSDQARWVDVAPDGATVYVTGQSVGETSGGGFGNDWMTIAYDAATGDVIWEARRDGPVEGEDGGQALVVSPDGARLYVTGHSETATRTDYATVAYDAGTGRELWEARYDGGSEDVPLRMLISPTGDRIYVTGYSIGALHDFATVAYDADGSQLWVARFAGAGVDIATGIGVDAAAGRVYVTGLSAGPTLQDYATIAYDAATGDELWTDRYDGPAAGNDVSTSLAVSSSGTIFVSGHSAGTDTGNDLATVAYDGSGQRLWVARYDGPGNGAEQTTGALAVSPDGERVYVGGTSLGDGTGSDYAVIAYEAASGAVLWGSRYAHPSGRTDALGTIVASPDGNYVFATGRSVAWEGHEDATTVTFDAGSGEILWVSRYNTPENGSDWGLRAAVSRDSTRVYVTGMTNFGSGCSTCWDYLSLAYDAVPPGPRPPERPDPTPDPDPGTDPGPQPEPTYPVEPADSRSTYPAPAELNDTYIEDQWGAQKIAASEVWHEYNTTGFGIKVAVIDTGVDLEHEDLQCPGKLEVWPNAEIRPPNQSDGSPDDDRGHGTHVAGIIGACSNNATGMIGVAPDATLVPIQALRSGGSTPVPTIGAAVVRAVNFGAHVINLSLGTNAASTYVFDPDQADFALEYAHRSGVVIVAAAGNDTLPLCNYPAKHPNVLCVGATDPNDVRTYYSSGPNKPAEDRSVTPGVVAPGGTSVPVFCGAYDFDILSLWPPERDTCDEGRLGYRDTAGTSMAAPHVAGLAALLYDRLGGVRSEENAQRVTDAIVSTADDLGLPGPDPLYGYGRVNATRAAETIPLTPHETSLALAASTPNFGQYSDDMTFEARLTHVATGRGMPGAKVTFGLEGSGGSHTWATTTNGDGIATVELTLTVTPGIYTLSAEYAGDAEQYAPAEDARHFFVAKESAQMTIEIAGRGRDRSLLALLRDDDPEPHPIADREVRFFVDGTEVGSAITNGDGLASLPVSGRDGHGHHVYEAMFDGDTFYAKARAITET